MNKSITENDLSNTIFATMLMMIQLFGEQISLMELTGFVFGVAGVWLTLKENSWCFPVGLINVSASLVLFFHQKLYSDAIQQVVYFILLSYGWYKWVQGDFKNRELKISYSSKKLLINLFLAGVLFSLIAGTLFHKYTDASLPYWDAAATSLSFIAQWMIARKKIENWILWLIVNAMYIGIYIYKDLLLFTILFSVYFILAIKGWVEWRKTVMKNNQNLVNVS